MIRYNHATVIRLLSILKKTFKKNEKRKKKERETVSCHPLSKHSYQFKHLRVSMSIHQCNTHEIIEKITKKLTYCTTEKNITVQTKTVLKNFPF